MNEIEDLYKILGLIGMIVAFCFGLIALIKSTINNALKPIEKKLDDVVSKELYEAEKKAFRKEMRNEMALKFKDIEIMHTESIAKSTIAERAFRDSREEHHKSKHRIDEVYGKLLEKLDDKKK